jgi:hypothetical protein
LGWREEWHLPCGLSPRFCDLTPVVCPCWRVFASRRRDELGKFNAK